MKAQSIEHKGRIYEIALRKYEPLPVYRNRVEYIAQKMFEYENMNDELYHKLVIKSYKIANMKVLGCKY